MRLEQYQRLSGVCLGRRKADLVLKNCRLVDVFTGEIVESSVAVKDGVIVGVSRSYEGKEEVDLQGQYLAPGFIDAHLHLESGMVSPAEFIRTAAQTGTTCFIVDPHEAANVSGADGIDYILAQTEHSPANVYVMMPSCVPATELDDNGGIFAANDMFRYLHHPRVLGLGEVMDNPAVIGGSPSMFSKIELFDERVIDGHVPKLTNKELSAYKLAGVDTDHEATSFEAALEEARRGIHVHIREGSAAHNLESIVKGLIESGVDTEYFSFCTDDKHIEDILREGHIAHNVRMAVRLGLSPIKAIKMATINTARCYGLKHLGAIGPGFQADFVILKDLEQMEVSAVYHKGRRVETGGGRRPAACPKRLLRTVQLSPLSAERLRLPVRKGRTPVIGIEPAQITTRAGWVNFEKTENFVPKDGYLKLAAIERHHNSGKIGLAIAEGYGLRGGALASTVSHDSHNIIVIGDNDEDMALAVNELIRLQGGYVIVEGGRVWGSLPLPVMGLMSEDSYESVHTQLGRMIQKAHEMGVPESVEPFLTLSFLALPVIPELRITTRGISLLTPQGPKLLPS